MPIPELFEVTIEVPENHSSTPPYKQAVEEIKTITGLEARPVDGKGGCATAPFFVRCHSTKDQLFHMVERKYKEWTFTIKWLEPTLAQ